MISAGIQPKTALYHKVVEIGRQIGNTPLHDFTHLSPSPGVTILAKKEWLQIGGSVKARAAYFIIRDAVETGALSDRTILMDATSGNTGIAYAAIAREMGIQVALCLPENASRERKEILQSLDVDIIYTSPLEGTDGSQQVARDLVDRHPGKYFYADQYKNENNWKAHYHTTALELLEAVPELTHFVAGMGTTGTFVGTGRRLREARPDVQLIALQPDSALHGLEGWKHLETAVVPTIYDPSVADRLIEVTTEQAYETLTMLNNKEKLLLSPSSAANIAGALQVAASLDIGTIVTILPDNADKYSEVIKKLTGK
ncbi:MAG TPA: cysteine synthase family protein [Flavitalea sp.]|nr:cysteine synthase family protein [Flavitalea sp.]